MRILVDQSGYDLLNLGDAAMLQACVRNLAELWPGASISVICHDAEALARYCPGTIAVPAVAWTRGPLRLLQPRIRLGVGQANKMVSPYAAIPRRRTAERELGPVSLLRAIRRADLVVAAGGGYVNDTWWWHGVGVLSVLDRAQRSGTPTAMFGQGLGPLTHRLLWRQASRVLPRLKLLGLREGVVGRVIARDLGCDADRVVVTGDDALRVASEGARSAEHPRDLLGLNARVSGYAGVDTAAAGRVGEILQRLVAERSAAVVGLPVSRYDVDPDLAGIRSLWPGELPPGSTVEDIATPIALATAAAGCRAVVTGSYHAAVFSMAAGVPVVCLTNSPYYDAKFAGLAELFPGATSVVPLEAPGLDARLSESVDRAWRTPDAIRRATADRSRAQISASADLYRRLADLIKTAP